MYDEEFVVALINSYKFNIDLIDNVMLNRLANQHKAPHRLIKMRAEYKRSATAQLTSKGHFKIPKLTAARTKQSLNQLHSQT